MAEFKDNLGRDWRIELNGYNVREIRQLFGVRLPNIYSDPDESRRAFDRFDDILLYLTEKQRDAANVDERSFLEQMGGDAAGAAETALESALMDFFPPRRREAIQALKAATEKVQTEMIAKTLETIDDR